jgi:hypothetical protein
MENEKIWVNSVLFGKELEIDVKTISFNPDLKIVEDFDAIIHLLSIGTNIPILPEFRQYILYDLNHFKAKSLLLVVKKKIVGHVLVYHHEPTTLFFGFFGVSFDKKKQIITLIRALTEYAKQCGFRFLKGPVNIPTIIYGWGFMDKDSSYSPFIHKPVSAPIYLDCFQQNGFSIALKEYSYEGKIKKFPNELLKGFDLSEYEVIDFTSWEDLFATKKEFLLLNAHNLPQDSVVTPDTSSIFDNYFAFTKKYGKPNLFVYIRHIPTNTLVGCFAATPNPLQKDREGNYNSMVLLTIVLDKEHRNKGIAWLLAKQISDNALEHNIQYITTFVGSHVSSTREMCERYGLDLVRTHYVLSYSL